MNWISLIISLKLGSPTLPARRRSSLVGGASNGFAPDLGLHRTGNVAPLVRLVLQGHQFVTRGSPFAAELDRRAERDERHRHSAG